MTKKLKKLTTLICNRFDALDAEIQSLQGMQTKINRRLDVIEQQLAQKRSIYDNYSDSGDIAND